MEKEDFQGHDYNVLDMERGFWFFPFEGQSVGLFTHWTHRWVSLMASPVKKDIGRLQRKH